MGDRDLPTTLSSSSWSILIHSVCKDKNSKTVDKVSVVVFEPAKKRSRHRINKFSPFKQLNYLLLIREKHNCTHKKKILTIKNRIILYAIFR